MRMNIALLLLFSVIACHCNHAPPCVDISEGVYGWTGDFVAEPGGGFEGRSMSVAWLAEARDGAQVPNAIALSDSDGFFQIALPAGVRILCVGTGTLSSFQVDWAEEDCMAVDVQSIEHWSYVIDIGDGEWIGEYGPELALCE
jgi:hypothetical protein